MSLYDVLGVPSDAPFDAIRSAYRQKLLQLHPDKAQKKGGVSTPNNQCTDGIERVQQAWDVLRDQGRRAQYDAQLAAQQCSERFAGVPWMTISLDEMDMYDHETGGFQYEYECRCGDVFELAQHQIPKPAAVVYVTCRSCTNTLAVTG